MAAPDTEQLRRPQGSMFDLMERMKVPVLWVCVVIMGGFGVWWLFEDLFPKGRGVEEVEMGSFEIPGGAKKSYTNFEFEPEAHKFSRVVHDPRFGRADTSQIGQGLLGVQVRDELELAWAYLILRECARSAGVLVTDEVIIAAHKKRGVDRTLREYQRQTPADHREVTRDLEAIRRFRNAVDEAQPEATWDKVYERFKTTNEDLKATFVLFDTQKAEIPLDATSSKEDRDKLEKFITENPGIRAQKRIPEELDAHVLYVRFNEEPTEKLKEQFEQRWKPLVDELKLEVTDEKLRARFDVFRSSWEKQARIASDQWEKEHAASRASRPIDDRPTEFELLKDRLRIEYLATRLVEKAFEEVTRKEKPLTLEEAMSKYGLKLTEIKNLDSQHIQQHPDFPTPRGAEAMLRGLREKTLKPGDIYDYKGDALVATGALEEPGGAVAIWKVTGYHPEREASLDDPGMITHFTEEYRKKKRQDLAKEEAEAFKKAVEEKVTNEVATRVQELEAAMTVEVEKQIAEQKLDRNKPEDKPKLLEIENAEKAKKDAAVDAEKAKVEPNMFLAVCQEKFLTPRDTGWIAKTSNRNATFAPNDKLSISEKAEQFFRKAQRRTALAAMKVGRIGPVEVEPNWFAAAVPMLTERRVPTPEDLYLISKGQLDQLKGQVNPRVPTQQFWSYESFKRPEWFNLNVPSIEKAIVDKRDADAKTAAKKRLQEEKKKQQAKVRAEKVAQDAMQARPLFSGEDW
jgi:hypothetical protein